MAQNQATGKNVETTIQGKIDQRHQFLNELAQAESDYRDTEKPLEDLRERLSQTKCLLQDARSQRGVIINDSSSRIKTTNPALEREIEVLSVQEKELEDKISQLIPAFEGKKKLLDAMRSEARSGMSITADDLVYFREKIASKSTQIEKIEAAIEENKVLMKTENQAQEKHQALSEQKENLLAGLAMNKENTEAFETINKQIAAIEKQIEDQQKEAMAYASGKSQTISGLRRMLSTETEEKDKLEKLFKQLLNYHLLWRAEQIGAEYIKAAQTVEENYKKLFGIEVVLERLNNQKDRPTILGNACQQLQLPGFPIKGCEAKDREGFLFIFENGGDFIDKAFDAEAMRLAELGVCQIQ